MVVPESFQLHFSIQGATFVSAGNGAPDDMNSFRSHSPKTWQGKALIIVRPDSPDARIEVTVTSDSLADGKVLFDGSGHA